LDVTAVTSIPTIYQHLAPFYDWLYGPLLQPGRRRAMARLAPRPGESILEVGVGTGVDLVDYRPDCRVVAVDLSMPMLARARGRLTRHRIRHVEVCRMDAMRLAFPDASFDAVYAPYIVNVVPEPARAAREWLRVCRPGGRLVFLNHFEGLDGANGLVNKIAGQFAATLTGVNWHLDFDQFLRDTGLCQPSIELVNFARVSAVVAFRKP
jgi:phosphatidylethanolamine/phosphatidyl-N-methylethanolamine N-methyltransferase